MSEIEYEIEKMMLNIDEEQDEEQTDRMIETLNIRSGINRQKAEAEIQKNLTDEMEKDRKKARRRAIKHSRRKWRAVKRSAILILATAALFGFEQLLGFPHELALVGMVALLALASYITAVQILPEVLWYINHKAVAGR